MKTPYYLYDIELLKKTLSFAQNSAGKYNFNIHYAIKANHNPAITKLISQQGFGVDCVSGNEISEALKVGFKAKKIVFAGAGKSDEEIKKALQQNILCLNCESIEELEIVEEIAISLNKKAQIAIRVNPDIKAHTHHYITTGTEENKFGIHTSQLKSALDFVKNSDYLKFVGLHFHIGSQITNMDTFINLCKRVNTIWKDFNISDYNPILLNMGGGLGVDYEDAKNNTIPPFDEFFSVFAEYLKVPSNISIHFELGRSLVAQCGKLITKVLYTKKGVNKTFVITDAGMTELMRPALYQARHYIENTTSSRNPQRYDIVGPVCESSDVFGKNVLLPETRRNDLIAIHSCGAYAESMMLRYNMRQKIKSYIKNITNELLLSDNYENNKNQEYSCKELKTKETML